MAQNITIQGASYSDVPAVTLPKTGGGTATFTDVTDTTAAAADVATGKYFYTSAGVRTQGTNSGGGGGASNFIAGTFQYSTTSGEAQTITLDYSGNGYPIACAIVLDDGVLDPTYTNTVARYSIAQYFMTKTYTETAPTYSTSGDDNQGAIATVYKSSASNAATLTRTSSATANTFSSSAANNSTHTCVRFTSKTKMSIYSGPDSGTSRYGFFSGKKYRYWVIYSE